MMCFLHSVFCTLLVSSKTRLNLEIMRMPSFFNSFIVKNVSWFVCAVMETVNDWAHWIPPPFLVWTLLIHSLNILPNHLLSCIYINASVVILWVCVCVCVCVLMHCVAFTLFVIVYIHVPQDLYFCTPAIQTVTCLSVCVCSLYK